MKRAWMLWSAALILLVISSGCGLGGMSWRWGQAGTSNRDDAILSEPIEPAATSVDDIVDDYHANQSEDQAASLAQQIEQYYVARANTGAHDVPDEPVDMAQAPPTSQPAEASMTPEHRFGPPPAQAEPVYARTPDGAPAVTEPPAAAVAEASEFPLGVDMNIIRAASPLAPDAKVPPANPGQRQPRIELVDIRPALEPAAGAEAETSASANQPTGNEALASHVNGIAALINQLEQSVTRHPEQLDSRLKLGLLYLIAGQDKKTSELTEIGDPVQSELLSALLRTLTASKEIIQEPSATPAPALLAADELHRLLGQRTTVVIPKMTLVTHVNSFGDYKEVPNRQFPAGQPVNVFLYTEIANFRSKPTTDGKLLTQLSQKVEVFDATGRTTNIIWQRTEPRIEDRVSSPRRDFFIPFPVELPANTPPGEYILKVTVEDLIGHTTDQQRMTLTITP